MLTDRQAHRQTEIDRQTDRDTEMHGWIHVRTQLNTVSADFNGNDSIILQTREEIVQQMNGYKMSAKENGATFLPPSTVGDLPTTVDWRTKGYVTPVKNQVISEIARMHAHTHCHIHKQTHTHTHTQTNTHTFIHSTFKCDLKCISTPRWMM